MKKKTKHAKTENERSTLSIVDAPLLSPMLKPHY